MAELVTLERFDAAERRYHVYRIRSSALDHTDHCHDYFQVCCVTCGRIVHRQEGKSVELGPGDAFIIPPGFIHSLHFGSEYSETYSLAFAPSLLDADAARPGLARFLDGLCAAAPARGEGPVRLRVELDEDRRESIVALLECLTRQQRADCPPALSAAPGLIASILYLLAQAYRRREDAPRLDELVSYRGTLTECVRWLDGHWRQNVRPEELARRFGLSRSVFCAVFPQFTGLPLHRYVAQKRVAQAQLLIRTRPELPLGRIGQEVGYEDPSTFYRSFLRVAGLSPAQYRDACREREKSGE